MSRYLLLIWIGSAFLFFAACSRGGNPGLDVYLRTNAAAVDSPASVDTRPVKFRIEPGTTARQVSRQLEEAGLIRDALLFEAFVRVNDLDNQIQAGAFVLNPSMTLREIVTTLERGAPGLNHSHHSRRLALGTDRRYAHPGGRIGQPGGGRSLSPTGAVLAT